MTNGNDYAAFNSLDKFAMPLSAESKYPNRRAYVLKVRSDATADTLAGRLENLVTGGWREFASGQELLDSIATDLDTSSEGQLQLAMGKP